MQFKGPLFIIGLPRSETKLLRDLLNNHSNVSIPESESHFIPFFIKNLKVDNLKVSKNQLKNFVTEFNKTNFYLNIKSYGINLDEKVTLENLEGKDFTSIIEFIFRNSVIHKDRSFIWGDKTPGYIKHIDLLKEYFKSAKFIHIVRDPRDYCLSVNKAWKKDMLKAASIWNNTLRELLTSNTIVSKDVIQIKYEDLITKPTNTLTTVCDFLGIEFESNMVHLKRPSENIGSAKGSLKIVSNNLHKWESSINPKLILRIEKITKPMMEAYGYTLANSVSEDPLKFFEYFLGNINDLFHSLWFHINEKGIIKGTKYFINHHRKSSWH